MFAGYNGCQMVSQGFSCQLNDTFFEEKLVVNYQSAFDFYRKNLKTEKLTTGSMLLDSLIGGGIERSTFTLFYGDRKILRMLIHRLLINVLLDVNKGGFSSPAIYICCSNYRRRRTLLNPYYLADMALSLNINPARVFKNVYVAAAFNPLEQYMISRVVGEMVRKTGSKLVLVDNIALLLCDEKMRSEFPEITLTSVVGNFWKAVYKNDAALVVTCGEKRAKHGLKRGIPLPEGHMVLMEKAAVAVYFKVGNRRNVVKAYLCKHPYLVNRQVALVFNRYRLVDNLFGGGCFGQDYGFLSK